MIINDSFLEKLIAQAKHNQRLRVPYDLRNTPDDNSQRTLNAIEPGTIMPIQTATATATALPGGQVSGMRNHPPCNSSFFLK